MKLIAGVNAAVLACLAPSVEAAWGKKATAPPPPPPPAGINALLDQLGVPEESQTAVAVAASVMLVLVVIMLMQAGGGGAGGGGLALLKSFLGQESKRGIKVDDWIGDYNKLHHNGTYDEDDKAGVDERNSMYAKMVNAYYELATLFYEWGWGQSFHFAEKRKYENFVESIRRHEYYLASQLEVKPGMKVLDVGCGIGGPYRNIAQFTGCDITGITLNEYQVKRANEINRSIELGDQVRSVQCDFMDMKPFGDNSFDAVYAIEATCHAPVRQGVYSEIKRVLKPGAVFACYEWCLTDKYDAGNAAHRKIKKQIEEGDGLPDMARPHEVVAALKDVGFEVLHTRDMALDVNPGGEPWYLPLMPSWKVWTQRFQFTEVGMALTKNMLWVMEMLWLAPKGTYKVQQMLQQGGIGCSQGGVTGTFTPMFLCVCRKPIK
eukprot:CAMPEP_0185551920 /NCGR_PEP_ID=MMETSP1381-20130426/30426_1 /TAXON_ID=298111 /ORGANISM="Pavlova sp., Strain CCMP459" /LENGTH=433 /DNA_ID=CAMNT_0028164835 /DNA_START=20 /DNA_END=1321 /DNA_ORIENTATION=-